ncbi:unnamed protein product [Kuraishia capsulata CBS 1993]|uniref:Uncharacterized protein n=1 Tax=Kuraishia capsulata CBS 1993 TaxID=1382522 RepID=W6MKE8_9ASCO|nr:uncharacterized protein KUCA_T00001114001 [Kuraishia capsulata CBS 1993]CDK25147.1 unnamed protein product [Kuraishia capsulata CBS 1993]
MSQIEDSNPYAAAAKRQSRIQNRQSVMMTIGDQEMLPDVPIQSFKLREYDNIPNYKNDLKVVVVGDGGCGKTSLLVSYCMNRFPTEYEPTIFENYRAYFEGPGDDITQVFFWDTAGQEEYSRLRPLSYQGADLMVICFSVNSKVTLSNVVHTWYPEIKNYCENVPIVLVGLKSDLYEQITDPATFVERGAAIEVAKEIGALAYAECSARTMHNVHNVFDIALSIAVAEKKTPVAEQGRVKVHVAAAEARCCIIM